MQGLGGTDEVLESTHGDDLIQPPHGIDAEDTSPFLMFLKDLEQVRLIEEIDELGQRLDTLIESTGKMGESLSFDVLLIRLMNLVTDAFEADRSSLSQATFIVTLACAASALGFWLRLQTGHALPPDSLPISLQLSHFF